MVEVASQPVGAVELRQMDEDDYVQGFSILSDAFAFDHEYINQVFPAHDTLEGRKIGGSRLQGMSVNDPQAVFFKAVNTSTGEMMGMAKWLIFDGVIPSEGGVGTKEFWEEEKLADYADVLFRGYVEERRKAIRESVGHLVSLDLLVIAPKHQRRGAGSLLVEWGVKKADQMGVVAVVEASDPGRPLYEKFGFKFVKKVTVEPPAEFAHRPRQVFDWLVRPKTTKVS